MSTRHSDGTLDENLEITRRANLVFEHLEPQLREDLQQRLLELSEASHGEEPAGGLPLSDPLSLTGSVAPSGASMPAPAMTRAQSTEALASLLMEAFAKTRSVEVFPLLYELTHRQILVVILKRIRFTHSYVDPKDVLQDVFLSIYRYPHRFRNEKCSSFRNWSFSIVRNTLLKHLRSMPRAEVDLDPLAEVVQDERVRAPLLELQDNEASSNAAHTYALCLLAYRDAFHSCLKDREKCSLKLIEVQGMRYRDAAERMNVRLENLKMIVCRARKKLLRSIEDLLEVR